MGEHVEARSLASLNALANNPPQYPSNPTEQRRDPLTLYISRVPGTRDIILSPFRPQIKNVTAEDVASSLYYVHLNTAEDELLASNPPVSDPVPRTSLDTLNSGHRIQRKPVPPPTDPAMFKPVLDTKSSVPDPTHLHPAFRIADTLPVPGTEGLDFGAQPQLPGPHPAFSDDMYMIPAERPPPPPVHRRTVAPRILTSESMNKDLPETPVPPPAYSETPTEPSFPRSPRSDQAFSQSSQPSQTPLVPPSLTPLAASRSPSPVARAPLSPSPLSPSCRSFSRPTSRSPSPVRPFTPFSLTIIRRDPSSGQQWNVGNVQSFQLEHPEQLYSDDKYAPSPSISIHIETSGYAKFRGMPNLKKGGIDIRDIRESLDAMRPMPGSAAAAAASVPSQIRERQKPKVELNHTVPPGTAGFERQAKMTYGSSWTANIKNAFRRHESRDGSHSHLGAEGMPASTKPWRPGHSRETSNVSTISTEDLDEFQHADKPVLTVPGPGLSPKGYMFLSPWDGRCEFRTGNGGRSLRCRHVLPTFSSAGMWNPLVVGGDMNGDRPPSPPREKPVARDISEIRFNLPSSELFPDRKDKALPNEGRERARDRIRNAMTNRTEEDVDDDEYEGVGFDLTLGREKAGGGNRGKRAKMGKLIIWDDGLKMLDLVVAANVGIWWGVWEREFGGTSKR